MARPLWQLLVPEIQENKAKGLSCEECLRVLDYYVDWIVEGEDSQQLQASIARHLSHCHDCRLELEKRLEEWERLLRN
jgi:hypothetical protein